jgi:hypothetical protein
VKRRAGVAGILFVALSVAGVAIAPHVDLTQPDYASRLHSAYAGSANQTRSSLSFSLGILAVLSFILFFGGLCDTLREVNGERDWPSAAVVAAGATFAALFALGWSLDGVAGFALREVQTYKLDVDSFVLLGWLSILSRVAALAAAGTMAFGGWVSLLGYVVAGLAAAAVVFLWVAPLGLVVDGAAFLGFLLWSAAIALAPWGMLGRRAGPG